MSAKTDIGWIDGVNGYGFGLKVGSFGSCVQTTAATHDVPEGAGVDVSVWANSPTRYDHWYFVNDH